MRKPGDSMLDNVNRVQQEAAARLRDLWNHQQELGSLAREFEVEAAALRGRVHELEARVQHLASENQQVASTLQEIAARNEALAQLYVAGCRLQEAVQRDEIVTSIREITANLIGSEEVAIFERTQGDTLELIGWDGVDPNRFRTLSLQADPLGRLIDGQAVLVAEGAPSLDGHDCLSACVPLCFRERVVGAVLIFRLLQQKPRLLGTDRELCELIANRAAAALFWAQSAERSS